MIRPGSIIRHASLTLGIALSIASVCQPHAVAEESLIRNGNFQHWEGDAPQGWKVEIAARNGGDQPVSEVGRMAGPALTLRGDAKTMAWRSVSQEVSVKAGGTYRLKFVARSKGVKREGRQFDNCYVGWMSLDAAGKLIGRALEDVSTGAADWTQFAVDYTVPKQANKTIVAVFLSKTGLVGVKDVTVAAVERAENLLVNGAFEDWTNGVPDSWTLDIGAKSGADTPLSTVKPLGAAGVVLSGNARTMAWRSLSQEVPVQVGKTYTVEFEASAVQIRRQGRQYDNCYVGVMCLDGDGKRLDIATQDLSNARAWRSQQMSFTPPPQTAQAKVLIFLSKSGQLKIRDLYVREATPSGSFR